MPADDDLKAHAASNQDFYALLDLSPAANESEIRRAYRRTALKYHPDKISNPTAADIDKFHLLQIANDVLSDPAIRQLYDNAREARLRKQRERDQMGAAKRKMREDLEARERAGAAAQQGVKRPWMPGGEEDAEAKLQREIERIAEDGRRRRREATDKLKRELEEEQRKMQEEEQEARKAADRSSQRVDRSQDGGTNVSELERSVKVRWAREGRGADWDAEWLKALCAPFGEIEGTFMLKDKRARVEGKKGKVTYGTGVVVFKSIVSTQAAVLDSEKKIRQGEGDWALVDSVTYASGQAPDLGFSTNGHVEDPTPSVGSEESPSKLPADTTDTSTKPPFKPSFNFPGMKPGSQPSGKAPSFGSFPSAAGNAPKASSFNPSAKPSTPSLQEVTMMRLKNAQREKERKALEEEIAREDEAADAAEAAAKANSA
ncbi:putative cell cycle control protein (Cwf23) [Penicillium brasilianum]|uniref:Putative cell cycle control protein (Cwf23) n=1 Tax=Penicillium brasilianum TaxID=104259 RepID=A0A1S9RWP0_PENBI|nr:putative cell cycle control protein (Cwf23) [Penicillium brasilianum]